MEREELLKWINENFSNSLELSKAQQSIMNKTTFILNRYSMDEWCSLLPRSMGISVYYLLHPPADVLPKDALTLKFEPIKVSSLHSSTETTKSVATKFNLEALKIKEWPNFIQTVGFENGKLPIGLEKLKPIYTYGSNTCCQESDVQAAYELHVCRPVNDIMKSIGIHYGFQVGLLRGIGGLPALLGNPDSVYAHIQSDRLLSINLVVEIKTPWSLDEDDIIDAYNRQVSIHKSTPDSVKGHVMRAIEQAFIYATLNNLKYCVLSTFDKTWFIRKIKDPTSDSLSHIEISPVIKCDSGSLISSWVYLLTTIEKGNEWAYTSRVNGAAIQTAFSNRTLTKTAELNKNYKPQNLDGLTHFTLTTRNSGNSTISRGNLNFQFNCVFKSIDISKQSEFISNFENEVEIYEKLESLQGVVIPLFHAYGTLGCGYLSVIVTSDVGRCIGKDELESRRADIDACVAEIHKLGVIHGDLRLSNIMIDNNGKIWIIDFGNSRIVEPGTCMDEYIDSE